MTASVDDSCRLLAARYLREQVKQLTGQLDGVRRGEEIEYVHRARVASRRLRAAMRMFRPCFPAEQFRAWRKEFRKLTRGLGAARDKDVQIAFLHDFLDNLQDKSHSLGVARVLIRLERRRQKLQPRLIEVVDRFEAKAAGQEILQSARRTIAEMRDKGVGLESESLFSLIEARTLLELRNCLAFEDSLVDRTDHARHHQMRIAVKRLRYTLEISRLASGMEERLGDFVAPAKQAQALLGDLHDCHVWVVQLDDILRKERRWIRAYYSHDGPLAGLLSDVNTLQDRRRQEHGQVFEKLRCFWEELRREDVWGRLKRVVGRPAAEIGAVVG